MVVLIRYARVCTSDSGLLAGAGPNGRPPDGTTLKASHSGNVLLHCR